MRIDTKGLSVTGKRLMACRCCGIEGVDVERRAIIMPPGELCAALSAIPDWALFTYADDDGDRVRAWLPAADKA